ncbi:TPA: hypothetical protein RMT71_003213 [Escherichia coli]|nr:hypothetical protein [Escherichia coli]HDW3986217.1 hypothetical protein [Escherichia coli]
MAFRIDTGGTHDEYTNVAADGPAVGKHAVLFDPTSTYAQSALISVRPGSSVLLVGYNIPDDAVFTVEGVSVGSRPSPVGHGCCRNGVVLGNTIVPGSAPDILFRSPMMLGGKPWQLTKGNDRLVIALPGEYLLVLNDTQYLGDVQVELIHVPGEQQLPFAYMAGV